jgi:hypothetical protein
MNIGLADQGGAGADYHVVSDEHWIGRSRWGRRVARRAVPCLGLGQVQLSSWSGLGRGGSGWTRDKLQWLDVELGPQCLTRGQPALGRCARPCVACCRPHQVCLDATLVTPCAPCAGGHGRAADVQAGGHPVQGPKGPGSGPHCRKRPLAQQHCSEECTKHRHQGCSCMEEARLRGLWVAEASQRCPKGRRGAPSRGRVPTPRALLVLSLVCAGPRHRVPHQRGGPLPG